MGTASFFNNEQAELALQYIQFTDRNLFLTGRAGTGKTTFLKQLKELSPKRMIVVAPTGVAAINAEGVTIHSFFSLPFAPFIPREARVEQDAERQYRFSRTKMDIIKSLDLLVIDEISMVRADILDTVDDVLRRYRNRNKPFGGVQLLMIGDLQQLPPVVTDADAEMLNRYYTTNFFYGSLALAKTNFVTIELQHIYRQNEARFISLLNAVRDNRLTPEMNALLKQRTIPGFESDDYIKLTTHNYQAQKVNEQRLKELKNESWSFKATVTGDFPESSYPTDFELELKPGARVMFLKNDSSPEKAFFNGKIGIITSIDDETICVKGEEDGIILSVKPMVWQNMQYSIDEKTQEIIESEIGTFEQYPLKLAWAITIHKSQGLTFDKVIIDARAAFAHGQVYVALSRCRSLDGMVLSTPIYQDSLINSAEIEQFNRICHENIPSRETLHSAQLEYVRELLFDLFDFVPLQKAIVNIIYRLRENEQVIFGNIHADIRIVQTFINQNFIEIGIRFQSQVNNLLLQNADIEKNSMLQERISKASYFFGEKIDTLLADMDALGYETDNSTVKKNISDALNKLMETVLLKKVALNACKEGFTLTHFLSIKAKAQLTLNKEPQPKNAKKESGTSHKYPELVLKLRAWRNAIAVEKNVQPYEILRQKSLEELVEYLPTNKRMLQTIKGLGAKRIREYGDELLEIVREFVLEKGIQTLGEEEFPEIKKSTYDTSYDLYSGGLSIGEIAKQRNLSRTTIEGHLARCIKEGKVDIAALMSQEKIDKAAGYFQTAGSTGLTTAFEALHGEISYAELKYVLNYLNKEAFE